MKQDKNFGARLKELRTRVGLIQRELAESVDIDATYLSKIENGVMPPPTVKVITRLAEALETEKDEVIQLAGKSRRI